MSVYLDEPLPDEMLFSVIARYVQASRLGNTTRFLKNLMGPPGTDIGGGPCFEHLSAQTVPVWGMSASVIKNTLTLAPFYSTASRQMGGVTIERPYPRCAPWSGFLEPGRPGLRFCRSCWKRDDEMNNPRYWRRSHQLPGVITCIWHADILCISGAPTARRLLIADPYRVNGRPVLGGSGQEAAAWRTVSRLARQLLLGEYSWVGFSDLGERLKIAERCGYGAGTSLDLARMSRDLGARLGEPYMRAMGLARDDAGWLRRALQRPARGAFLSLPTLLVTYLLLDISTLLKIARSEACPGARWEYDVDHQVQKRDSEDDSIQYLCSCGFSFTRDAANGVDMIIVPTQIGPDVALAAVILASSGYSVARAAECLGLESRDVERHLLKRIEVAPWHRRTVRARHLASWVQLVDRLGSANLAVQYDGRLWRRIMPLASVLPATMVPVSAD